ncbi:MAG: hypothetical protein V9F04_08510 [Dermatophilaceae bacterium]
MWRSRKRTDGYSGADIEHVCEGSGRAGHDGGHPQRDGAHDRDELTCMPCCARCVPRPGPWFDSARNVVQFANADGTYDELRAYMKRTKRL